MTEWSLGGRVFCAALMGVGAVLLALRVSPRAARVAWLLLLAAGLAHALLLSLLGHNVVNINVAHYYLGAKYSFPYPSCYRLINAAADRPQVALRNLENPSEVLREDPREQRAYYIDALRAAGVDFDAMRPLEELRERALESGALRPEAERILAAELPPGQDESFRRDVNRILDQLGWQREITTDYGFNGSPFYALVRQLDPTLHRPFGRAAAVLNLTWQVAAVFLLVWVLGAALDLDANRRLATAALVFASWDFVGYALPGLVFAGLWLPVAVGVLALHRKKAGLAGVAIAWAGLIKLFPFVLLLPAGLQVVRSLLLRRSWRDDEPLRFSVRLLGSAGLATVVLGSASLLTGRSWGEFLQKILAQFQSDSSLLNSVSLSQAVLTLGSYGWNSPLPSILAPVALAILAAMFLRGKDKEFLPNLPRRALVLLAATGWLVHTWFNYNALVPLLLLPLVAQWSPRGAALAAAGLAMAFVLPEFDDPALRSRPLLHALKVAPYLLIPAWFVARELRLAEAGRAVRWSAGIGTLLCLVTIAGEAVRLRTIQSLDDRAGAALQRGDAIEALVLYHKMLRYTPDNAMATMNAAIAQATLGNEKQAERGFAEAAALAPESPVTRQNYGRWLLDAGEQDHAAKELEAARALAPHDEQILCDLAQVRQEQGREGEARALLLRALELDTELVTRLEEIPGPY